MDKYHSPNISGVIYMSTRLIGVLDEKLIRWPRYLMKCDQLSYIVQHRPTSVLKFLPSVWMCVYPVDEEASIRWRTSYKTSSSHRYWFPAKFVVLFFMLFYRKKLDMKRIGRIINDCNVTASFATKAGLLNNFHEKITVSFP